MDLANLSLMASNGEWLEYPWAKSFEIEIKRLKANKMNSTSCISKMIILSSDKAWGTIAPVDAVSLQFNAFDAI